MIANPWGDGISVTFLAPRVAQLNEDVTVFGRTIPKGYITDGASVPGRFARYTDLFPAALKHDEGYDPMIDENGVKQRYASRLEIDRQFRDNVLATLEYLNWQKNPESRIKRIIQRGRDRGRAEYIYRAVRLFGGVPWDAGTKRGTLNVGGTR